MKSQTKFEDRYSRQIRFRGIGVEGQKKLGQGRVVIVGCGATGSALSSLLARAGVGYLRIIDRDYIESSNLQRQVLFDEADAAFWRDPYELTLFPDGRAIIKGTTDTGVARSLYARFVGS